MTGFFRKLMTRLFCNHQEILVPKLSSLSGFEDYKFTVKCKRCGKKKRMRGRRINAGWFVLQTSRFRWEETE